MAFCVMIGCSNKSTKVKGHYSSIPVIRQHEGPIELERSGRRRKLWLKAISRADLTESKLRIQKVCSRHFVSGRSAAPWDEQNVDWVPTLHLGHGKFDSVAQAEMSKRRAIRHDARNRKAPATVTSAEEPTAAEEETSGLSGAYERDEDMITEPLTTTPDVETGTCLTHLTRTQIASLEKTAEKLLYKYLHSLTP